MVGYGREIKGLGAGAQAGNGLGRHVWSAGSDGALHSTLIDSPPGGRRYNLRAREKSASGWSTEVRKTAWHQSTSWDTVCRRAIGRRKFNAIRQLKAQLRRGQVLRLLHDLGWGYRVQVKIAAALGVSEATVSRDLKTILPLYRECPTCGSLVPRHWAAED
jgi:hypothetical protein